MFSKLNNCFYSLKGNLFQVCFAILYTVGRFIGILFKVKNFGIIWAVAVFLPCFVYICPLFGGQVAPICFDSFQMAVAISGQQKLMKIVGTCTAGDFSVVLQENEFREKGDSEFCGGFIELLPSQKIGGVFVSFLNQFHAGFISEACAQGSAAKTSEDGGDSTNNSDRFSGHNTVSFQWVVGYIALLIMLMIISWGLGLWVFYIYTQRCTQ